MLFDPAIWQAVSLGIDADDQKIHLLVHHNLSRGIAREAILRKIMVQHTPLPFRVSTGFIYSPNAHAAPPKQCDVLVHDLTGYQPYFQIDEFIVATQQSTKVIAEVKTTIGNNELDDVVNMQCYSLQYGVHTLGFGFSGLTFVNFSQGILRLLQTHSIHDLPPCIAVHEQNYIGIRGMWGRGRDCYLTINFGQTKGMAVAYFLNVYDTIIRNNRLEFQSVNDWFNNELPNVLPNDKTWITKAGAVNGNVP